MAENGAIKVHVRQLNKTFGVNHVLHDVTLPCRPARAP